MSEAALVQPFPRNKMKNPYVGPKPFEREDEYRFYGRTHESEQLVATIMGSAVTLLYAESGAGKTSLLRAKVIPMLERLDDDDMGEESKRDVLKPARVSGGAKLGEGATNIFTANVLNSIASKEELEGRTLTLAEYLRGRRRPQPETPGRPAKTPPIKPLRVLILDQFEELFTSGAEWWEHRQPFMRELAEALDEDRRLRVVIAMREEYVANMDPYAAVLPGALRTRVRLQRLREKSALEAVTLPLQGTGVSFAPEAAERLVRKLRGLPGSSDQHELLGEFVEPLHLQVVCSRIWQSLADGDQEITPAMIGAHGDIEEALTDYYDQCIGDVAQESNVGEASLRGWFERELITENKTRGIVFCGRDFVGSLRTPVAELIARRYLIRAEFRGGGKWYELSHDRMIGPVLESGRRWRDSQATGKMVKRLEDSAREWSLTGGRGLLTGEELAELDTWSRTPEGRDYSMSEELKELVQASRLAAQRHQNRRIRMYLITAVLAGITALALVGGFSYSNQKAQRDSMIETLLSVAERQHRKGEHFEALLWSVAALRSLSDQNATPPAALRQVALAASAKIGSATWLRTSAPIESYTTSKNGSIVVTTSKGEVCKWDMRVAGEVRRNCAPPPVDDVDFRASFVSDDGAITVLRGASTRSLNASASERPSFVVLDAGLKLLHKGRGPLLTHENANRVVSATERPKWQLTTFGAAGKLHEPFDVPVPTNANISPSGEMVLWATEDEVHLIDLRRRPPSTRVIAAIGDEEDIDSLAFSDDMRRLIVGFEPESGFSLERLQVLDAVDLKEVASFEPPEDFEGSLFNSDYVASHDGSEFVFVAELNADSFHAVLRRSNGELSQPKVFRGDRVSFDAQGLLYLESENGDEARRYVWWAPFVDWNRLTSIRLDADAKAVTVLGDGSGVAAIENGGVRLLPFNAPPEKPVAANVSAATLIERACQQLKWQPERELFRDACTDK